MALLMLGKAVTFVASLMFLLAGLLLVSRGRRVTGWVIAAGTLVNVFAFNIQMIVPVGWGPGSGPPGWFIALVMAGQVAFLVVATAVFVALMRESGASRDIAEQGSRDA